MSNVLSVNNERYKQYSRQCFKDWLRARDMYGVSNWQLAYWLNELDGLGGAW